MKPITDLFDSNYMEQDEFLTVLFHYFGNYIGRGNIYQFSKRNSPGDLEIHFTKAGKIKEIICTDGFSNTEINAIALKSRGVFAIIKLPKPVRNYFFVIKDQ
jgi:hypothetical protein